MDSRASFRPNPQTAGVPWMVGAKGLFCNNPYVVFMQSPPQRGIVLLCLCKYLIPIGFVFAVIGQSNVFRLYFGMGGSYVGTAKVKVNFDHEIVD